MREQAELLPLVPGDTPVVLDAFGLTSLPEVDSGVVDQVRGRIVATPNTGELARALGREEIEDEDAPAAVRTLGNRYGAAVGCDSWVGHEGRLWQITTGDTGLGTSGSGDVMAGATAGLLSRGAGVSQSLVWAKYVHAAAGETLSTHYGRVGYLAGELPTQLPLILRSLRGD